MPLMRPEVQKILRKAGLDKEPNPDQPLSEKLDLAGLSVDKACEELSTLAISSTNEALRLRALETALKVHGVLKDQAPPPPSFTIVINQPANSQPNLINGVNPILVPRQVGIVPQVAKKEEN